MKKLLLLLFALVLTGLSAHAVYNGEYDFEVNGIYYALSSPATVEVCGCDRSIIDLDIPTTVSNNGRTYWVTAIADDAVFSNDGQGAGNMTLRSVTIPPSVTYIGNNAFEFNGALKSVTFGDGVITMGYNVFLNCSALENLDLGNSLTEIGDGAFLGCESLRNVTIPNSVTTIGAEAFDACTGLTGVTIPNSVTTICAEAFAFTALTSVTIPNSVTYIGDGAFYGCTALTSVTIPNSVSSILEYTFNGCSSLTSVTIGSSVTSIQDKAFYNCPVLYNVVCKASTPPTMATREVFDDVCYSISARLTVPQGCKSAYESANWWKDFLYIAEQTYDFIVDGIYYAITGENTVEVASKNDVGNTYSGSVSIPGSVSYGGKTYTVTGLGYRCFALCSQLTSVSLPGTITSIGEYAFAVCSHLSSVTLPSSLTEIGAYAFSMCSNLTSLTIPNSVTYIGKYAFNYCRNLTNLTLPSNLINLGKGAFNECSGLTAMTLPNTVTVIQGETFKGCSALTSVTIPTTVTLIGSNAFNGCTSLTSVNSLAVTPPTIYSSTFTSNHYNTVMLTVPYGSTSAYQEADYWKNFANIIGVYSLDDALNVDGGNISFTSECIYPWIVKSDGGRTYAQSGNAGVASSSSELTATVTVLQNAILSFDFKAWGEGSNYDVCIFSIDGVQQFKYGARQNEWESFSATIPAGSHTLTWIYQKDSSVNPSGDYFAVDNVKIEPATGMRGDVNGDNTVGMDDLSALINFLVTGNSAGINLSNAATCDSPDSTTIGMDDLSALINFLVTNHW